MKPFFTQHRTPGVDSSMILQGFLLAVAVMGPTYKCKDASGHWSEAACTGSAAPPPPSEYAKFGNDKTKWIWHPGADQITASACVDDWRPLMKDPDSAQLGPEGTAVVMESAKESHIVIPGRARNSFGALGVHWFVCRLNPDGTVQHGSAQSLTDKSKFIEDLSLDFAYPRNN